MPSTQTDRLDGLTTSVAVKAPVRAAATGNVAFVGSAPYGYQTIDGIACTDNASTPGAMPDRVLLLNQSNATQNGIWLVSSLAWTRALDFDGPRDAVTGTLVYVLSGTVYGQTLWRLTCADNPIVIGTSNLTFGSASAIGGTSRAVSGNFTVGPSDRVLLATGPATATLGTPNSDQVVTFKDAAGTMGTPANNLQYSGSLDGTAGSANGPALIATNKGSATIYFSKATGTWSKIG